MLYRKQGAGEAREDDPPPAWKGSACEGDDVDRT